jgi:predicted esterase
MATRWDGHRVSAIDRRTLRSCTVVLASFAVFALSRAVARGEGATEVPPGESAPSNGLSNERAKTTGPEEPIHMEALSKEEKPPTFVMRGGPLGPSRLVFLHGMCGHALGYAQSFQFSAAKRGLLIAPQGDKPCQGPWASWSNDLDKIDSRIVAAFRRAGSPDAVLDVAAIGYSQGALRAEDLARKWPERYTRLVLIASPRVASARGLERVRSAVMMAGERDRKDLMKDSVRVLEQAGIPTTFMVIPEATHGAMGPTPEKTMGEALEWLFAHDRAAR